MSATPPAELAEVADVAARLRLACMRIARRIKYENPEALAPHLYSVLVHIEAGIAKPGALAEAEKVAAPSMTRTVAALVEEGYVVRAPDPDDGRCVRLTLTPAALEVLASTRASRDAWMARRVGELTAYEQGVLREATAILEALNAT